MTAFFLQQLINGLTLGAVYGLIAIGYTMVYGIIGMINFAHGEVYMVSAYLCAIGLALLSFFGIHSFPLLIFATLVFTIVVTGVYGWAIERIAYRPLRNSTRLAPLISAIGMSLILQNYVQLSQGPNQQGIPTLLSGALRMTVGDGVVQITWTKVFILVAALVGMLILTWIIQYTRLGRICRATQQDRRMAAILGINTDRVISLVFVIGAAMAGLAGVLVTMNYGTFDFYIGFIIGIKAFTAAVLGGIGSLPGAMLGGLLLGVAEAQFAGLVNSDYKDVFSFALLVAILVAWLSLFLAPQGINQFALLLNKQDTLTEFDTLVPGRFQAMRDGTRVTYTEELSKDRGELAGIFISQKDLNSSNQERGISILVAEKGTQNIQADGSRYLILHNGYRYDGNPGQANYRAIQYDTYGVMLPKPEASSEVSERDAVPTADLFGSDNPRYQAELQWRLSTPLLVFVVTLLAVPLSRVNPRQGRFLKLLPAILLYMGYLALLIAVRGQLDKGKIPMANGLWWVHGLFLAIGLLLFYWEPLRLKLASSRAGREVAHG